jgi:DNA-directed RNA polymerase specialized sigma24 family protein
MNHATFSTSACHLRVRAREVGPRIAARELDALQSSGAPVDPDIWLYRERTLALLRRYFRISIEVGRLPSLLGRELFRSKVTAYRMSTFEDAVIFVHDVERSLDQLDGFERQLIGKIVLQEYSHDEAAKIMGCWRRTVGRRFPETLDRLSGIFLKGGLLARLPRMQRRPVKSCQEAKNSEIAVSCTI